jgi:hypothetical protein
VKQALQELGIHDGRVRLAINRAPKTPALSQIEIEKLVNIPVDAILPECEAQFQEGLSAKHLLGQSRQFLTQLAPLARKLAGIKEINKDKKLFGLFRRA